MHRYMYAYIYIIRRPLPVKKWGGASPQDTFS